MPNARVIEDTTIDIAKLKWRDEIVPCESLTVDSTYQRHIVQHLVDIIAASYNPLLAGKIVVSRRQHAAFIVDGQQRWQGARQAGILELAAIVISGLNQTTEAQLFLALNEGRVAVRAIDRFRAAYHAGEAYAVAITDLVHELGGRIYGLDEPIRDHDVQAVEALRWIYRKGGIVGLRETLAIILEAFGELSQPTCPGMLVKGIFGVITVHRADVDRERLARRVGTVGTQQLAQLAHGMGQVLGAAAGQRSYYLAILQAYNDKLRTGALQPAGTLNHVGILWKKILAEEPASDSLAPAV